MCFSASASFITSASLLGGGAVSTKWAPTKKHIPFALVPLLFSLQQGTEGFVWLSLTNPAFQDIHQIATYIFLLFAQVFWPFWVPFSIWLLEKKPIRKKILLAFTWIGAGIAAYLLYCFISYPVEAIISEGHIQYKTLFPHDNLKFLSLFYLFSTIVSPIISSVKYMRPIGLLILAAFIVSQWFFGDYVVSVWCFFAAIISAGVIIIIWKQRKLVEVK